MNGVHLLARPVDEVHLGRAGILAEWIDLEGFLDAVSGGLRRAIHQKAAPEEQVVEGRAMRHDVKVNLDGPKVMPKSFRLPQRGTM